MEAILKNIMWFSLILLLLALTGAVIQVVIILLDVRSATKDLKKKLKSLTSVLDIATMLMGGLEGIKRRAIKQAIPSKATLVGFFAGVKKGMQVLMGGEK
ncbi:hypothetical protein HZC35_01120 [Candidatus Saganbacteria bacterium]|nr:hypothetical protein [Candidatus Saganbacteria bacterium]